MILIENLTQKDVGRSVVYHRTGEVGLLSSWNDLYVFVRFDGIHGQACRPTDISFEFEKESKPDDA